MKLVLGLLLAAQFACSNVLAQDVDLFPSVQLPSELERVLRDYETNWREGNPEGLANLFTRDGFVLSSSQLPVRGRPAIKERYANTSGNLSLRALSFEISDSLGYIVGGYSYDPTAGDTGKFVLAIKLSPSGRWHIAADIDNSNGTRGN
jgi:hypothetical protein